jgi:hypothetical protein
MTTLSYNDIALLVWGSGWDGGFGSDKEATIKHLNILGGIANGESGRRTDAVNGNAVGLWQVMTTVHNVTKDQMLNPVYCTNTARQISDARGGSARYDDWEAYTKKTAQYKAGLGHGKTMFRYLHSLGSDDARSAELGKKFPLYDTGLSGPLGPGFEDAVDNADSALDPVGKGLNFLKESGIVVGAFLLGLVLVIIGLWYIASQTKIGKAAIGTASSVGPAGPVKKLIK